MTSVAYTITAVGTVFTLESDENGKEKQRKYKKILSKNKVLKF
jgi:hypothetical protein